MSSFLKLAKDITERYELGYQQSYQVTILNTDLWDSKVTNISVGWN